MKNKWLIGIILTLSIFIFGVFFTIIGLIYSDVGNIRESSHRMELEITELKHELRWMGLFLTDVPNRKNMSFEDYQKIFGIWEDKK